MNLRPPRFLPSSPNLIFKRTFKPVAMSPMLRPRFTEKVARLLQSGKTINIHGKKGQGMTRLLDDLAQCLPQDTRMVRIDMKSCAGSFEAFLATLADDLGLPDQDGRDLRTLLSRFLDSTSQKLWLCLHHFDALSRVKVDNSAVDIDGYNINFLNFLNHLRNNSRVALLVCSDKPVPVRELYIGGRPVSGSKLEFSLVLPLPVLATAEIAEALKHTFPDLARPEKDDILGHLSMTIFRHEMPVPFLEFVCAQEYAADWSNNEMKQKISEWKREFETNCTPTLPKRIGNLLRTSRFWAEQLGRVTGIALLWQRMGTSLKVTLGILVALAAALLHWGSTVWNVISQWFN